MAEDRVEGFAPLADANSRILVLGTAPSALSLKQGFYYAHPRNAFWPILCAVCGEAAPAESAKRALALRHGIALWDTLASCERKGSLDSAICRETPNDIASFLRCHPSVERILLNGTAAARLYRKYHADEISLPALCLPSTSPALTMPFAQKLSLWREALQTTYPQENP